ncbi:hypothetical protein SCOR_00930 [Sulfidibacter corallicola]|uniref:hypothetical protein n=1 Tax=Sulfidibacter corallicola TaxID=2818388 RepID=UPI001F245652|nr:hypothetical protein [Sulfidibacter corallicola]
MHFGQRINVATTFKHHDGKCVPELVGRKIDVGGQMALENRGLSEVNWERSAVSGYTSLLAVGLIQKGWTSGQIVSALTKTGTAGLVGYGMYQGRMIGIEGYEEGKTGKAVYVGTIALLSTFGVYRSIQALNTNIAPGGASLWESRPPGVQVRRFGDWWVKRINPKSNRLMQWWARQSVNAPAKICWVIWLLSFK